MKTILEGSKAIAETVNACQPGVVSAYPITPQTHIVEELAKLKADGKADFEYVLAESEFAAASIVQGATAVGVRAYSATSSQGLLLMTEVLYNIAGMRLPLVLTDANRAVSAPINIHNDQQDAMAIRDAGWIMLFGETVQEVCDLHLLAYKVSEKILIPVLVNLDGFVLTHVVEPVDVPSAKEVKRYLPDYRLKEKLDVENPLTLGAFATPEHYFEIRKELHDDLVAAKKTISQEMGNFRKVFHRSLSLVEYYGDRNADTVLVALGSVVGTIKEAADELRKKRKRVGVLKIVSFRPLPEEEIIKALAKVRNIAVIDKSVSLGAEGILATELRRILTGKNIVSFVLGLGGRDITREMIKKVFVLVETKKEKLIFLGR